MVKAYIDYFRQLAIKHPGISHTAGQEGLNAKPNLCRFGRFWNMDLYLAKTPSGITSDKPALHLQMFDVETDDSTGYEDVSANFDGGILITEKAILNNALSEEDALASTFEITLDFYKQMHEAHRPQCGAFQFEFASIKSVQVGPIWDNRFGWYTTFEVSKKLNLDNRTNAFEP